MISSSPYSNVLHMNPGRLSPDDKDDDFAMLDKLLDTLTTTADGPDLASRPDSSQDDFISGDPVAEWVQVSDLDDGFESAIATKTPVDVHTGPETRPASDSVGDAVCEQELDSLLHRFCEGDDDGIVDVLLDKFATSSSDASMLIEALGGKGVLGKVSNQLSHMDGGAWANSPSSGEGCDDHFGSPCLTAWDDLFKKDAKRTKSDMEDIVHPKVAKPEVGNSAQDSTTDGAQSSTICPAAPESVAKVQVQLNVHLQHMQQELRDAAACQDGSALLAALRDVEDFDAMRSFMRTFLVRVRRRVLGGSEAGDGEQSMSEDDDCSASVW
eukprot:CAMPEP_0172663440 /NCGR_PEP_ID=MMETSP1074-20121228/5932_1 /TAXON_ID=2916 /ORGANISM="Ceratium fusus, Strain PA161109" /LENGTH=325 /DNA_ID=CAMNT_0013479441 /DNA_START=76 /DNA_END=1050 /DNA_ORIENTATION=+